MSAAPPTWTPLARKVDLSREVTGNLPAGSGAVTAAYNLGDTTDGLGVLQGEDPNSALAFYRLNAGQGVQITPSPDGHALTITSTVISGGQSGVMLQSVYDPTGSGTVLSAGTANAVPWTGISGKPNTFPPTLPINESDVTNLIADLAGKVPLSRQIITSYSLEGGATLAGDVTISLIGDVANPGAEMRYGTNASGVLGWYPASTGVGDMSKSVYDTQNRGYVDLAAAVVAGGVTAGMLAAGVAVSNLGYTPVNKAGDTMTGPLAVTANGPNVYPNMYQQAQLLAQVSTTGTGYPTIGLSRQASGGGAVAIWYNSGHQDLNLEYADGTAATLLSSISQISGGQLIAGSVPAGALAAGAAQANLGYRPINWAGDTTVGSIIAFQRDVGLAAISYSVAPIRVQSTVAGARPQIGFWDIAGGYASSLYLEYTDQSFRNIGSDGVARVFHDDRHNNYQQAGTQLVIQPSANLYVAGSASLLVDGNSQIRNGAVEYIESGASFVMQAGSRGYLQAGSILYVQGAAGPGGGQINLNGDQALYANGNPQEITIINECGVAASSYGLSTLYIRTTGGGGRPGIAFHHAGLGFACFLYYDSDNKLRFIDAGGSVHTISST